MKIPTLPSSQITSPTDLERRSWLKAAATAAASAAFPLAAKTPSADTPTAFKDATGYNNYYELSTDKDEPARLAAQLKLSPWSVVIDGLVAKPVTFDLDKLSQLAPQQERIYRLRCVEGWSMVIPWQGYSLSHVLKQVKLLGNARYVVFTSAVDRATMPMTSTRVLNWPYTEALRLDEAMHPLTLLAFGMYGRSLPGQNGAPVRLVVPWKYGFKSAKAVVKITLVEQLPSTSWSQSAPNEYGFFANVNPTVDHPRWSQATERRIGVDTWGKRPTLMFNGYQEQVASLYAGMDLRRWY